MFNNAVLDVTIGLVFIYLLYSLLASTVKEFIATIFEYRGKMLERGIEQMLDGKNYKYFWWDRLRYWMSKKAAEKPDSKLALKKGLFASNITSHELYRRSAENATDKRPSYLAADTFSDILIDVMKGDANDSALLKNIEQYVDQNLAGNEGLQKILKMYLDQANGDLQKFKLIVENWYNDTMDRVSGWYKQQSNRILMTIGLFMAVIFNVSTIEIVDKLSTDKTAREALVQNATQYVKSHMDSAHQEPIKPAANPAAIDTSNKSVGGKKTVDSSKPNSLVNTDTNFTVIREKLDSMKKLYKSTIEENNTLVGLGWDDYGFTSDSLKWVNDGANPKCKPEHKSWPGKVIYILKKTATTPRKWLGFLLTAFAISLGAPFWFDLLNRFINLRASGAKPGNKSSTPVSKTALLNQKPDPTAKG